MEPPRLRVLVVDNYSNMASSLRELLHAVIAQPMSISIAFDGAQGLALVWAFEPHVVLLDIDMPIMNGMEAAGEIRKRFF